MSLRGKWDLDCFPLRKLLGSLSLASLTSRDIWLRRQDEMDSLCQGKHCPGTDVLASG